MSRSCDDVIWGPTITSKPSPTALDLLPPAQLEPMDPRDVRRVVAALPEWLVDLMQKEPLSVAGGFPRAIIAGEVPKDIDVWSPKDWNIVSKGLRPRVGEVHE